MKLTSALARCNSCYKIPATSEWQKAIDVAERLVKLGKDKQRVKNAHFYCELALQHMASDDLDRAMTLLKKGAAADKNSARVSIMMGRVFMAKGEYAKAVESLQRVISRTENWLANNAGNVANLLSADR